MGNNLYIKAQAPSTGGDWVRPAEWLPLPTFAPTDNRIAILVAVYENAYNINTFAANSLQSTIYWGDGTSNVSNGGYQNKLYDYASLSGSVYTDEFGRNYKQVIIDIVNTPSQTLIRLGRNFSQPVGWLDFKAQSTTLTTLDILVNQKAPYLKKVDISGLTQNSVHGGLLLFQNARNLAEIDFNPNITGVITSYWFSLNYGLTTYGDFSSSTTNAGSLFQNASSLQKIGNVSLPNATANNLFDGCRSLSEVGNLNLPSCTTAIQMFRNAYGLTKVGTIVLSTSCASVQEMFLGTNVEEVVFTSSLASVTNTANLVGGCNNLRRLVTPGLTRGVTLTNANMSATALNEFFTSLGTAAGAQTLVVTGNPGSATCDTSIATGKGYTVTI